MDSAIGMSEVTVAPSDSASQAPKAPASVSAPSKSGGPRKGSHKPGVDKDAPQGAVKVQPGGQSKTGKKSPVQSTTIPLSGWGEIDLYPYRRDIEPTFTVDARPYADLVDVVYSSIQSRYSSGGKHIPLGLFRYYCFTMFWLRALWLHKSNANSLTSEQKDALNILLAGEEFQLPSHIAQYLGNMGNFLQGGEQYFFRMMAVTLGSIPGDETVVKKGWFETNAPDGSNTVDRDSWWYYAQLPSPGVYATYACNEANNVHPHPGAFLDLDNIAPELKDAIAVPTDNIIGWSNRVQTAHHSSWRATYSQLGWSGATLPPDVQTQFNISTSTLKWVSERLSTLKDFKLHSAKQLSLSVQGSPIQCNYLCTQEPSSQMDQRPRPQDVNTNTLNASRFSELSVSSRFAIDPKTLPPSFSFGYRLERSLVFKQFDNHRQPQYLDRSNYQPWLFVKEDRSAYVATPANWFRAMNSPFTFGSQPFMNVARFSTHQLSRSVGLDAALVLSDTR